MSEKSPSSSAALDWTDLDDKAVAIVRALAMDAVQQSGDGHPGTAMAIAPAAYLLFQRLMRHDPTEPNWTGRDRFVLSVGHSSLTLYIQLYLSGYGLTMDDLQHYRQWGSLTPGHPEHGHTLGVETTTGPLGQGISTAVGMAMAARKERAMFDPDAGPGESPFEHTIWVFAGDGDMQEGVQAEAASLAGHQKLGDLVVMYDDNHISIEGDTSVAFSEDVAARYEAYGWHTQRVDDANDVPALYEAFRAAQAERDRPSLISVRSIMAWPAPHAQNTGKAHGSALGDAEVAATKEVLGLDKDRTFDMPEKVLERARQVLDRGRAAHKSWDGAFAAWAEKNPDGAALHARIASGSLPEGWVDALPVFGPEKAMATRKASSAVIQALAGVIPEFWGGSADLGESNNTTIEGADSFLPDTPNGRVLHFGIREHAMGAALNGMALHGGNRPFGGTFLVFSDYMRPSVRLAALMKLPVTYVWTHDSIGLGGDGPTHQPVEHLATLRAMPGLDVIRPADANETAVAWRTILERNDRPAGLCLSRQDLTTWDREVYGSAEGTAKGGYVLADADGGVPDVILVATGSEVEIAMVARDRLQEQGTPTRVVSMPCREWYAEQEPSYQQSVLPPNAKARVSVEAAVSFGWHDILGDAGQHVSVEQFGASAPYKIIYEQYGITADAVVAAAHASLAKVGATHGSTTGN